MVLSSGGCYRRGWEAIIRGGDYLVTLRRPGPPSRFRVEGLKAFGALNLERFEAGSVQKLRKPSAISQLDYEKDHTFGPFWDSLLNGPKILHPKYKIWARST